MRKIKKIGISNFQIWDDVEIELGNFNVIKGSSNSGKSAIVRSINMVFNNDWHKSWLRKDESKSTIKLTFNDDSYIKRTRGSVNSVSIKRKQQEEEMWSGFGSTYPQEVVEFLNVGEENCSYQFDSHFFLSLSPSKRALTLGTFSDLQKIDDVLNNVQKNIRDNEQLIKSIDLNLESKNKELINVEEILKAKEAVDILVNVDHFNTNLQKALNIKDQLDNIALSLNKFKDLNKLTDLSLDTEKNNILSDIIEITEQILLVDEKIKQLNQDIKPEEKCPTCGQLIEEDHEKEKKA